MIQHFLGTKTLYAIARDITEQLKLEQEEEKALNQLYESQQQLALIVDNIGDGVIVANSDKQVVLANYMAHQLFGIEDDTKIPAHFSDQFELYYPDEKTLMIEENYKNGILEGTFKSYYKTGRVTEILNYKGGKLHGNTKRFADNGALLDDLKYCNGKLEGIAKYYNVDGELIYTGNYANDEKVGEWEYYENGKKENVNKLKQ